MFKITKCQICNNSNLINFLNLNHQPLANTLSESINANYDEFPLKVLRCPSCSLVQLEYIPDQRKVYHKKYPYVPSITQTVNEDIKKFASFCIKTSNLKNNDLVIDIGSNDGLLLSYFKDKKAKVLGMEPTDTYKIAKQNKIPTINNFFNYEASLKILKKYNYPKLITATNVFAHMTDLKGFMRGIKLLTKKNGFFIFENHYFENILKKNQYDTFYHEHVRTYSLHSLIRLFKNYNLNVNDAMKVTRYGGSIRVVVSKNKYQNNKRLKTILTQEKKLGIFTDDLYNKFIMNVEKSRYKLLEILYDLKKKKLKVVAKGCPARAIVLLHYCNIDNNLIKYVAEQSTSLKLKKYIPGLKIPIVDSKIMLKDQPDYILLLSWHLKDKIIKKWKNKGLKSKFIIPLPYPKII